MKLPTPHGIDEAFGNQPVSRRFYLNCLRMRNHRQTLAIVTEIIQRKEKSRSSLIEDLIKVKVHKPDKKV